MRVKICGIKDQENLNAATDAGAAYLGFVFFEKSPRNISYIVAKELAQNVPAGVCKVALTVNASTQALEELIEAVPLDMLQLHGTETPERVAEIRADFGLPVMKAVGIADEDDLPALSEYMRVSDQILIDAKPPKTATLPGGNGLTFDWRLIAGRRWATPWMLAGGLTPSNVAEAIELTGATQVDVSTGVETAKGQKDPQMITEFLTAAV